MRSMEMLLFKVGGLLQNWIDLCPPEKKEQLKTILERIKGVAKNCALATLCNSGRYLKMPQGEPEFYQDEEALVKELDGANKVGFFKGLVVFA